MFDGLLSALPKFLPLLIGVAGTALVLWIAHWLVIRRGPVLGGEGRVRGQLAMLALTAIGAVVIVLVLPVSSTLRKRVMDTLHEAGIEIVSPTFMNQRVLAADEAVIPEEAPAAPEPETEGKTPEALIFDKAEEAEKIVALRSEQDRIAEEVKELKAQLADADAPRRALIEIEIARRKDRTAAIETMLRS